MLYTVAIGKNRRENVTLAKNDKKATKETEQLLNVTRSWCIGGLDKPFTVGPSDVQPYYENTAIRQRLRIPKKMIENQMMPAHDKGVCFTSDSDVFRDANGDTEIYINKIKHAGCVEYSQSVCETLSNTDCGHQISMFSSNLGIYIKSPLNWTHPYVTSFAHVLYLVFYMDGIRLINYILPDPNDVHSDIIQTFRNHGVFVGCAIGFDGDTVSDLITLNIKDETANRYYTLRVSVTADGGVIIDDSHRNLALPLSVFRNIDEKQEKSKRYATFKVSCRENRFLTSTVVTTEAGNETFNEKVDSDGVGITKTLIVSDESLLEDDRVDFSYLELIVNKKEIPRELPGIPADDIRNLTHKMFYDNLIGDRVRALTIIGNMKVPYSFCRVYRILYLFRYDIEKDETYCVHSN